MERPPPPSYRDRASFVAPVWLRPRCDLCVNTAAPSARQRHDKSQGADPTRLARACCMQARRNAEIAEDAEIAEKEAVDASRCGETAPMSIRRVPPAERCGPAPGRVGYWSVFDPIHSGRQASPAHRTRAPSGRICTQDSRAFRADTWSTRTSTRRACTRRQVARGMAPRATVQPIRGIN